MAQLLVSTAQAVLDTEYEVRGLNHWGNTLHQQGKSTAARKILEDALTIAYRAGPKGPTGEVLLTLGVVYAETGERSWSEACFQEGLQLQRSLGNRLAEQRIVIYLGRLRIEDGDYQAGQRYLEEAMHLLQLTGSRPAEARIANSLGYVDAMLGNYTAALEHHAASRRIRREIQQPIQESHALHNLCTVERKRGNLAQAEETAGKITDRQMRHSFWHAAPAHRQLRALWQAAGARQQRQTAGADSRREAIRDRSVMTGLLS